MDTLEYEDRGLWPAGPDGSGGTLANSPNTAGPLTVNGDVVLGAGATLVADAIAACDIASTAVGVGALGRVAAPIAEGLRRRSLSQKPLNIIVC